MAAMQPKHVAVNF